MTIIVRGLPGQRGTDDPFTEWREMRERRRATPTIAPGGTLSSQRPDNGRLPPLPGVSKPKKPDLPWWQDGLGLLVNNPVAKAVLQPLDVLGVPQRAIASTIQEVGDFISGDGFSGKDWYNQINPLFFAHGENAEDNIGMGDVIPDTGNKWVDRTTGFLGDVATDPLTYVAGLGVADKVLDGARLSQKLTKYGKEGVEALADMPKAVVGTGHRGSMAGRRTRTQRIQQARENILKAGLSDEVAAPLYDELRQRATRGLGARGTNSAVADLVDEAMGIDSLNQGVRFGIPFRKQTTGPMWGTRAPMRALSGAMGEGRARMAGKTTPIWRTRGPKDASAAMKFIDDAQSYTNSEFLDGLDYTMMIEKQRPYAGTALNVMQPEVSKARKKILDDAKRAGGNAKYLEMAEKGTGAATLGRLFEMPFEVAAKFGVTLPRLGGDLNYVPHILSREFVEFLSKDQATAKAFLDAFGDGGAVTDMLRGSGRLRKRGDLSGVREINGHTIDFGDGTIHDIVKGVKESTLPFKGNAMETNPITLIDDYVQIISDDIGRRAALADMAYMYRNAPVEEARIGFNPQLKDQQAEFQRATQAAKQRAEDADNFFYDEVAEGREEVTAATLDETGPAFQERLIANIPFDDSTGATAKLQVSPDGVLLDNGWRMPGDAQGVLMKPEMNKLREIVGDEVGKPNALKNIWNYMNNIFKTYALLTPGFHMRNFMSALFMNVADGVPLATSLDGMQLWTKFHKAAYKGDEVDIVGALKFLQNDVTAKERQALMAVFASGAGGRFAEKGVAEAIGMRKFLDKGLNNPGTRLSQKVGARVEGSIRAGVALDTVNRGGDMARAADRITRLHFDYSETSTMDDKIKQMAPFWSFYSRNMPLQIVQQIARPRAYAGFEHFRRNFADPSALGEGEVPGYIEAGKGIPLDLGWFNWFEPDLPHTKVFEDVKRLAEMPQNPLGMAGHLSPQITGPLEFMMGQDTFTGKVYGPNDVEKINWMNPAHLASILPALASGSLKTGPDGIFLDEKLVNTVDSMMPLFGQFNRLTDGSSDRQGERWARYVGLPVRNITEDQMDQSQYWDAVDENQQLALMRALGYDV